MGSFCAFGLIGSVNSNRFIHILDLTESVCSSIQKTCILNIKYTEHHLSFDVLLKESEEKVCSLIILKRNEMSTNFSMIFSGRNKILLRKGMNLRKLLNQIQDAKDAANDFSTLVIDFLLGDTDREASVNCTSNGLSITLNAKQHLAPPSNRDPVGIFPTSVRIPSEVLYAVLEGFTRKLEQGVVGHTLGVSAEMDQLLLSIHGTELRKQLDAGDRIQVQGQLPVQATYDLYNVWYLTSMLRKEHGQDLVNADAVFMWNAREHKLSLQVRSKSGEALGTLIIY